MFGGILLVIITKIIAKIIVPRNSFFLFQPGWYIGDRNQEAVKLRTPCRGQSPKNLGKEGSGVDKPPSPFDPRILKGHFESENPHFHTRQYRGNRDFFDSKRPFLGSGEMLLFVFFWNPLYPILVILTPVPC